MPRDSVDSALPPAYSACGTEISPLDTIFGAAPAMTKGTFGEHLRREREMRGVSLDEVSQATRIGTRFLEALEGERWKDLPGGVFNRGFLRSIARYLGLDEEALVAEYAQATNDRPQIAEWAPSALDAGIQPQNKGHRRLAFLVTLLILVSVGAGGWWAWMQYGSVLRARLLPAPVAPSPKPPATSPAVQPAGPAPAAATTSATMAASGTPEQAITPAGPEELVLRVEVSRTTDVTVSADGNSVFQGRMTSGESRTFKAKDRFDVSAKNSFALVLDLNGVSMPPVGQPDSPGSVTLTRKDLGPQHAASGEPH